ncbi:MAG: DEAD/DEAH box helicase [Spirochaetaceae bacterium]|nr:DEAD/DEAH box helicase [Spirochaetaceae bacterium]
MPDLKNFEKLGLSEITLKALAKKGFETPSEIQEQCIPLLLQESADVIGQAQTGTGKTAAFGLPIMEVIDTSSFATQAIILEPTRELAIQVAEEIASFAGTRNVEVAAIYGGASIDLQLRKLRRGVQIVVGTPGRVMDHLKRGSLKLMDLKVAVLDEADEMLDMGFIDDIESILSQTPANKRMLCFSATMPDQIMRLTSKFMKDPTIIRIKGKDMTCDLTEQLYYVLRENEKLDALCRIIDMEEDFYALVFCKTKIQCDDIGRKLQEKGYKAEPLHGDLSQKQREQILDKMKKRIINIVVATDVAARGIDINDLTHVINFSIPQQPESYIHRIGRTGRAGKKGTAITFVTRTETRRLTYIERIAKTSIAKGKIPSSADIIAMKKSRIEKDLLKLLENPVEDNPFSKMAAELLEKGEAQSILSNVLVSIYKDQLDERKYRSISVGTNERDGKRDRNSYTPDDGNVRLFIARGRKDGLGPRELVDYLKKSVGANDNDIDDVTVRDEFSFVTAPQELAENIMATINATSEGAPIVSRAKVTEAGGGDGGRRRSSRGRSDRDGDRDYRDRGRGGDRGDRGGDRGRRSSSDRPHFDRSSSDRPHFDRSSSDRPSSDRSSSDRPDSDRPSSDRGDRFRTPKSFDDRRSFDRPTRRNEDDQPYGRDSKDDGDKKKHYGKSKKKR